MRFCFYLLTLLCLMPLTASAAASLGGHFKSLNLYQQSRVGEQLDVWLSADTLRLNLQGQLRGDGPIWDVALEQLVLYRDPTDFFSLPDREVNRVTDLSWDSRSDRAVSTQLQVDRLSLVWETEKNALTIGRQGIGFGRISLFSPLDIIAPFSPTAFDNEVRPGVDALRLQHYFGIVGEAGISLVAGEVAEQSSLLADLTLNAAHIDVMVIGGRLRDRTMAGIGFAGQLGGLGWKGEVASYRSDNHEGAASDFRKRFNIAGFELEYRLPIDLILQVQYLYNGAGGEDPAIYPLIAQSAPLREGLSYLLGREYLMTLLSKDLTPLIRLSGLLIRNMNDESWLLRPVLDVSLADNLSVEILCNFYQGDQPLEVAGQIIPQSEFGLSDDGGGFLLKVYF